MVRSSLKRIARAGWVAWAEQDRPSNTGTLTGHFAHGMCGGVIAVAGATLLENLNRL